MPFDYTNAGVNNYASPEAKNMLAKDQDNFSQDFKEQAFMAAGVNKTNSQPAEPTLDLSSLETNTTTQEPELDLSSLSELEPGTITVTAPKTPKILKPKTMMEQTLQLTGDVVTGAATSIAEGFDVMTFGLPKKAFNSVFDNTPDEQLTEDQRAYKEVGRAVNNASQLKVPSLTHLLQKTFGSDQDRLDIMDYQKALTQGIIDELQTQGIQAEARTNDAEGDESQGWSIYVKDAQGNDIKLDDPSMLDSMATEGWTIGLGVGGGILGAKTASQFTKNPFLIGAAALTGAVSGTTTGTLLDMLKANIKLNNDINGEQMKAKLAENASLEIVSAALAKPISMLGKGAIEGANIIKNYIFKGNVGGAVKEALIHTGLTREEGLKLVEEYSKFYNVDLDAPWLNSNKQLQEDLMLLRTLGSTSSKMGGPVADIRASDRAIRNATIDLTNRANIVIDKVASADPGVAVEVIQKDLPDYIKNVKAFYGDVKNSFAEFTKDYRFDLNNVIKGVKEQIPAQFKDPAIENKLVRFLSDIENNTIPRDGEALIRFKQELGDFIHENKSKMSYDVSKNLGNLAKAVDNEILRVGDQLVPENTIWKSGWKTANEEYSKMKSLEINSLYKALTRPGQSQDDLIRTFANYADTYDNTFFDVVSKLPKETRSKIDNAMMKHFVDKNTLGIGTDMQAIDFIKLDSQLKNVKFSDPEMIAHKDVIRQMSKLFKNDKALFQYAGGLARPSSGNTIATTAEGKVKAGIIQTLWDMFKSRIPTEGGRVRALFSALKTSFENPLDVKAYDEIVKQLPIDQRDIRNPLSFASQMQQMRATYAGAKNYQQGMGNVTPSIEATSSAPLEAEVIDFGSDAYKNIKSQENPIMVYSGEANDIIEAEIYPNQRLVITKDGHILPMEQLLQGERLPDNMRLPAKVETPVRSFFDMRMKLKTEPDLIKARNDVANAKDEAVKARLKQRLVNLLNYHKLRDEGLKPAEAHRAVYGDKNGVKTQMSAEVTAGLIGGGLNGVTIDDDGDIEVDVNKFMIGFGAGVVGVAGVKKLGKTYVEGEELAMQQAGGGIPPQQFKAQGVELKYSRAPYSKHYGSASFTNDLHVLKIDMKNSKIPPEGIKHQLYKIAGTISAGGAAYEAEAGFTKEDKIVNTKIKVPNKAISNLELFEGKDLFHSKKDKGNTALYLGADLKNEDPEIARQIKAYAGIKEGKPITDEQSRKAGQAMVMHRYGLLTKYGTFDEDTKNKLLNLAVFDNRLVTWLQNNKNKSPMNYIKNVANTSDNENIKDRHTFTYINLLDRNNKATDKMVDIMLNKVIRGKSQSLDTILSNKKLIESYKAGNKDEFYTQAYNAKYISEKDYKYLVPKRNYTKVKGGVSGLFK